MNQLIPKTPNKYYFLFTHPALWAGIFTFILFRFFASYVFYYQEQSQLFFTGKAFFLENMQQPGGFLQWLSSLLTAFYYDPGLGAFELALLIAGIVGLLYSFRGDHPDKWIGLLLPSLSGGLLVLLYLNYQISIVPALGFFLSVLVVWIFNKKKTWWLGILLWPAIYYLLGAFALAVLALQSVCLFQPSKINRSFIRITVLWLVAALSIGVSWYFIFYQTISNLLTFPLADNFKPGSQFLFTGVFMLMILQAIAEKINLFKCTREMVHPVVFRVLVLLVVWSGTGYLSSRWISEKDACFFEAEKLFNQQKYKELIQYNRQHPPTNQLTNYCNNVALCEAGVLCDQFFSFPQSSKMNTLFLPWKNDLEIYKRGGCFYYTIGMVNEAHRWAFEFMVMKGYNPEVLKMLIRTELINGHLRMAEKYINKLGKTLFYKTDAHHFSRLLKEPGLIAKSYDLVEKKTLLVDDDYFVKDRIPEMNLEYLCEQAPQNKKALQYKLAYLLWKKDINGVVAELYHLKTQGYERLPKHVAEAVTAYKLLNLGNSPNAGLFPVDPMIKKRFNQYYQTFQQYSNNKDMAQKILFRQFGDTFWYYVFFG